MLTQRTCKTSSDPLPTRLYTSFPLHRSSHPNPEYIRLSIYVLISKLFPIRSLTATSTRSSTPPPRRRRALFHPPLPPPSAGWKAVLAFYIMLITMVLFQSFIVWAKKEHPRRYLQVTLVGLWLVPPCLALSRYCSVRFPPHPPPTLAPTPRSTPRSTPSNPHPVTHTK